MTLDIIMPTCKEIDEVNLDVIMQTRSTEGDLIFTGLKKSASCNRNLGLDQSTSDYIIMIDDDMEDFFPGWDQLLLDCLLETKALMVSARLMNKNGTVQATCSDSFDLGPNYVTINHRLDAYLPSACICFKNTDIRFDEGFIGSGWEDTDFCRQMWEREKGTFVINNLCRLTHLNEAKNQSGPYWLHNSNHYKQKWNLHV